MGFLKSTIQGLLDPQKAFDEIENVMRECYDLICKNYPDESDGIKLKMTLESRYRKWSDKEIEIFLNDFKIKFGYPSIEKLAQKVIQNEKGQLIGWNRNGITKEGEFIIKKNILYNIEQGDTLEEAIKLAEKGFNDLCRMYNPLQVKNLMYMMPNVLHSVQWHK